MATHHTHQTRRVKPRTKEWVTAAEAVRQLRRRGIKRSESSVRRYIRSGQLSKRALPGCRSWTRVHFPSLLEALACLR